MDLYGKSMRVLYREQASDETPMNDTPHVTTLIFIESSPVCCCSNIQKEFQCKEEGAQIKQVSDTAGSNQPSPIQNQPSSAILNITRLWRDSQNPRKPCLFLRRWPKNCMAQINYINARWQCIITGRRACLWQWDHAEYGESSNDFGSTWNGTNYFDALCEWKAIDQSS